MSETPASMPTRHRDVVDAGRAGIPRVRFPGRQSRLVAGALLVLTAAIYGQTLGHEFVNYDDGPYVVNNAAVNAGLTGHGLAKAFTFMATNWHPVTWVSHMVDVELFGLRPRGHHLTNVVLHAGTAVLVFAVLKSLTGALWRSALVAALFAVHPLNVEPVAWVAQRKTVLSTLLFWCSLASWLKWVRRPTPARYGVTVGVYALGLMAKPMLVTFPFVLVLLDWWPLGRFRGRRPRASRGFAALALLKEKLPLLALAGASVALTWLSQLPERVIVWVEPPLWTRVGNAVVSYGAYLVQAIWPARLAVLYPYPAAGIGGRAVAVSAAVLTAVSVLVWRRRGERPYLACGWCWFLGALVPVIGLVQVGAQARADRYTYLPLVGIFLLLAWLADDLSKRARKPRAGVIAASVAALAALGAQSYLQTTHWRDSVSLNEHGALVTADNTIVLNNLAAAYLDQGRAEEATVALQHVLRVGPDHVSAIINLGHVAHLQRRDRDAVDLYRRALRLEPYSLTAHFNFGYSLFELGRYAESLGHFETVLSIDPTYLNVATMVKMARVMRDRSPASRPVVPAPAGGTR